MWDWKPEPYFHCFIPFSTRPFQSCENTKIFIQELDALLLQELVECWLWGDCIAQVLGKILQGNWRFTNQIMVDWELHFKNEVKSCFTDVYQLKIITCTLCCLPLVLILSCRCEILFGWNSKAGEAVFLWVSVADSKFGRPLLLCGLCVYRRLWNMLVLTLVPQFHIFK